MAHSPGSFMRADPTWLESDGHSPAYWGPGGRGCFDRRDAPDHGAFNGHYLRADWTIGAFKDA